MYVEMKLESKTKANFWSLLNKALKKIFSFESLPLSKDK